MNINDHKALAQKLGSDVGTLLECFNQCLEKHGFGEFKVIAFSVGPKAEAARLASFAGTPCPTRCRVLPDGRVWCGPCCD